MGYPQGEGGCENWVKSQQEHITLVHSCTFQKAIKIIITTTAITLVTMKSLITNVAIIILVNVCASDIEHLDDTKYPYTRLVLNESHSFCILSLYFCNYTDTGRVNRHTHTQTLSHSNLPTITYRQHDIDPNEIVKNISDILGFNCGRFVVLIIYRYKYVHMYVF